MEQGPPKKRLKTHHLNTQKPKSPNAGKGARLQPHGLLEIVRGMAGKGMVELVQGIVVTEWEKAIDFVLCEILGFAVERYVVGR
jgi:hypothetical protein